MPNAQCPLVPPLHHPNVVLYYYTSIAVVATPDFTVSSLLDPFGFWARQATLTDFAIDEHPQNGSCVFCE